MEKKSGCEGFLGDSVTFLPLSVDLCACLPIYPSILSICPSVCLFYLSIHSSIHTALARARSLSLSLSLSLYFLGALASWGLF